MNTATSIITCISGFLSILSGLAILWSYRQVPHIQNFTRFLLVCLTVADIFNAYGVSIGAFRFAFLENPNNDVYCIIQSFITTTSTLSSFFWTTAVAIYLFTAVVLRVDIAERRSVKFLMTMIPVLVPVTITGLALGYGALGENDCPELEREPWCWISNDVSNDLFWKLMTGKAWEMLTYIITLFIYILLKFFKWRENRRLGRKFQMSEVGFEIRDEDAIFGIAWLFLLVARIWGTARFIALALGVDRNHSSIHFLLYMQCVGDSSQAFWNFVFFFSLDPELRRQISSKGCWFPVSEERIHNFQRDSRGVTNETDF